MKQTISLNLLDIKISNFQKGYQLSTAQSRHTYATQIFILIYVTLLDDPEEREPLLQPFACMQHGVTVDLVPHKHGGKSGIQVEGE
jgi:hypothetical protein